MERKAIPFRLDEEAFAALKATVTSKGLTINGFLEQLVRENCVLEPANKATGKTNRVQYYLTPEDKEAIEKKASSLGLSPSEYIRYVASKKSDVELDIQVQDLHGLCCGQAFL